MHVFYNLVAEYPLLALAQMAFTIWMAVNAHQRRAEQFWYWVILFFQPLGPWIYLFAVVKPSVRSLSFPGWQKQASLAELRYHAEQSPTLTNQLALGQALLERGQYAEAMPSLEAAHRIEPQHGQVLFALALCHFRTQQPETAAALLERIIQRDPRWSNYQAWRLLLEVQAANNNRFLALEKARQLVNLSPTLEHQCLLGELLIAEGRSDEAGELLNRALDAHAYAPGPLRRHNRRWAAQARKLLKQTNDSNQRGPTER